ncbi:MAG: nitrilase-related carbon-nitrogen hydrolase, partial [Pseudomonadota bacterium]
MDGLQSQYKAAIVQAAPVYFNLDAMIDKTIGYMEEAAKGGASLIGFAENWIGGYPFWIWLGSPFWAMRFLKPYHDNGLALDSP